MRWRIFDGALNTTILIDFLRRLIRGQTRKLFLILDNLRVQHAKQVKAWLAEHADAIEVFYLPSYSPELKPDEMANADIKQAVTKQAPARTKLQLSPPDKYSSIGGADENLDYQEVVHVFVRRQDSSGRALHQAWQTGGADHPPVGLSDEERIEGLAS